MVIAQITTDNRQDTHRYHEPEPWFGTAPEALLQGFASVSEVTVHVISCSQQPVRTPEKLAPNIFFHSLHVPKLGWLRTGYQGCIRAVRRKLLEIRPQIVHGQGTERECAISAALSGFPNVVTLHGNMRLIAQVNRARPFSYQWLAARLEALTLPRAGGVVCITDYTRRAVAGLARRTWVVPNAVDASFFEVPRAVRRPPTLLCVGNITVRKNQNRLIEALDVLAAGAPFKLLFLGAMDSGDSYAARFKELIATRTWCEYGGTASRTDLKQHLAGAAALLLPSLEDNCPMVVLEAMAAGVPLAAARVGGVPELIEEGHTGLFMEPHDDVSMQRAVERLLRESEFASALATNAKQVAHRRFHPRAIAAAHVQIYRELLSKPS
jgi:glycosyltransferase involved in cell wall biosynthesis